MLQVEQPRDVSFLVQCGGGPVGRVSDSGLPMRGTSYMALLHREEFGVGSHPCPVQQLSFAHNRIRKYSSGHKENQC